MRPSSSSSHIGHPRYVGILAVLLLATCSATAQATSFTFTPERVVETPSLHELSDDDVDVAAATDRVKVLNPGDELVWDYIYAKGSPGYKVLSSAPADIDLLALYGRGVTGTTVDVTLQFSDLQGKLIGQVYRFAGVPAAGPIAVISDDLLSGARGGDDILGDLRGLEIGDFHLTIGVTKGHFELTGITFNWEADDIEPVPEPGSFVLLASGLAAVVRFRRRRGRSGQE